MSSNELLSLTGKTLVPISSIAIFCIGLIWITEIKSEVKINTEKVKVTDQQQNQLIKKIDENTNKLSRIEGALEFIVEKLK